jgi:hypothetical protein
MYCVYFRKVKFFIFSNAKKKLPSHNLYNCEHYKASVYVHAIIRHLHYLSLRHIPLYGNIFLANFQNTSTTDPINRKLLHTRCF